MYQTGKIYVKVTNNSTIELTDSPTLSRGDIQNIFNQFGVINVEKPFAILNTPIFDRTYLITFTDTLNVDSFIINLETVDVIEYAEKVPMMYEQIIPNDPLQSNTGQQYLNLINANGSSNIFQTNPGATGNTVVAIVDDAVLTTHEDLAANIFTSNRDVADLDNDPNPPFSGSAATNGTRFAHGTHVAGIAGAVTDNNTGIASVGWSNHIMGVKTRANSDFSNVLPYAFEGVAWAVANGAQVINMSWGGAPASQTHYNILTQAQSLGIVLVAAAGNNGMGNAFYPAAYGEGTTGQSWEMLDKTLVIAVAALDNNSDRSIWTGGFGSNFGDWVDIAAYGTGIFSSISNSFFGSPINNQYSNFNGTSMAAPMVSGVAGIMRAFNPSASTTDIYNCLVYAANPDIYNATLHPTNTQGTLGHGRLDAEAALQCLSTSCANNPIAVIFPSSTSICPGGSVILTANQGISYLWSTGATTQNINVNTPGVYSVTVTFAGNCTATTSINISNVNTTLILNVFENSGFPNDGIMCGPGSSSNSFSFCASATGSSYSWNPFGFMGWGQCTGILSLGSVVPSTETTTVTVTDMNGCIGLNGTASFTVQSVNPPTISIARSSATICEGQSVQLTASGANTYVWSPATGLSSTTGTIVTATPSTTTTYTVIGTDVNGCTNTFSATITVTPVAYTHPNGITISSNTTWTGQNFKINGPVFIEDNATLTIDGGSVIEFGPQGIIRNDQFSTGGVRNITNTLALVVNNATLTGLAGCSDNFWKGINITGEVEITNATIENAQTGINLHDLFDLGNNTFIVGGRLDIAGTTFRNNQRAIVMDGSRFGRLAINNGSFENTTAIPNSFTNQVVFIAGSSSDEFIIQNTSFNEVV
ncbi:MAG: S8 family serine peptidase [Vicingaceae bacterium]|nr:S8 family serine peptidase [Vicingaceae bacterium]